MKRAAFFDVDGTVTTQNIWRGYMEYFKRERLKRVTHLAFTCYHYPLYFLRRFNLISESAFRKPWARNLAWYVRGISIQDAQDIWRWVVDEFLEAHWRRDSLELVRQHIQQGDVVVFVSASPDPIIQQIAKKLAANYAVATRFEVSHGYYTGRSLQPVCIDEYKAKLARECLSENDIQVDMGASYAYADSVTDVSLLEMVGNPVAVHPDDSLREVALKRKWRIFPDEISA